MKSKNKVEISQFDKDYYKVIRKNVSRFLEDSAKKYDSEEVFMFDIAPQVHEGVKAYF